MSHALEDGERRVRDLLSGVRAVVERDDLVSVPVPEVHWRLDVLEPESPVPGLDPRVVNHAGRASSESLARGSEQKLPDFRLAEDRLVGLRELLFEFAEKAL